MDQLRAIRTFIRVVERGSFSLAASDLGLSHGMASSMVKQLEARLGVELIRRTTRRMALTEEGMQYLETARRLVQELDDVEEEISRSGKAARGSLVVQAPSAFSRLLLAPSLGEFLSRHDELSFSLLSRDKLPDLIAEQIDMLIYTGELPDSSLVSRALSRFPIITVAAPSYLERNGIPETPDDLERHDLISIISATNGRPLDWWFSKSSKSILRSYRARLSFENSETAIAAAVNGVGICQNISYAVSAHIATGTLVPILNDWRPDGPVVKLVTRAYARVPARLRLFGAYLEEVVREQRLKDEAILRGV